MNHPPHTILQNKLKPRNHKPFFFRVPFTLLVKLPLCTSKIRFFTVFSPLWLALHLWNSRSERPKPAGSELVLVLTASWDPKWNIPIRNGYIKAYQSWQETKNHNQHGTGFHFYQTYKSYKYHHGSHVYHFLSSFILLPSALILKLNLLIFQRTPKRRTP